MCYLSRYCIRQGGGTCSSGANTERTVSHTTKTLSVSQGINQYRNRFMCTLKQQKAQLWDIEKVLFFMRQIEKHEMDATGRRVTGNHRIFRFPFQWMLLHIWHKSKSVKTNDQFPECSPNSWKSCYWKMGKVVRRMIYTPLRSTYKPGCVLLSTGPYSRGISTIGEHLWANIKKLNPHDFSNCAPLSPGLPLL